MGSSLVVTLHPRPERRPALLGALVNRRVEALVEYGPDESLGLAVRARPEGPGPDVAQTERATGRSVGVGDVGAPVVGHHPLHLDPEGAVERDCTPEEPYRRDGLSHRQGPRRRRLGWRRPRRHGRTPSLNGGSV